MIKSIRNLSGNVLFFIILSISLTSFTQAETGKKISDGRVLSAVPDQLETYVVSLGEEAGVYIGDIVQIFRGDTILARAIFTSVQKKMGIVVTLGNPVSPIQVGDTVRFEKAGKLRGAPNVPVDDKDMIKRQFIWHYSDMEYTFSMEVSKSGVALYKKRPRTYGDYSVYVTDPGDDEIMASLARTFQDAAKKYSLSQNDMINLVISFVQNLKYTSDNVTTSYDEYPRYPIETLADEGGDCEDTAILMAAILQSLGLDAVLLKPPHHMAVGVGIIDASSFNPPYPYRIINYNDRSYAYLETTGDGYHIGEIPPIYEKVNIDVIDLLPKASFQVIGNIKERFSEIEIEVKITVINSGAVAGVATAILYLEREGSSQPFNQVSSEPFALNRGQAATITLVMNRPPSGVRYRYRMALFEGNRRTSMNLSEWFTMP